MFNPIVSDEDGEWAESELFVFFFSLLFFFFFFLFLFSFLTYITSAGDGSVQL